jgi:hypothetical protein
MRAASRSGVDAAPCRGKLRDISARDGIAWRLAEISFDKRLDSSHIVHSK